MNMIFNQTEPTMETNFNSRSPYVTMETERDYDIVVPLPMVDYGEVEIEEGFDNLAYEVEPDYMLDIHDKASVQPAHNGDTDLPFDILAEYTPASHMPIDAPVSPTTMDAPMSHNMPTENHYQGRTSSLEELNFRLRFAHITPGNDWFQEVILAGSSSNDKDIPLHVFRGLRGYPLSMAEKLNLHGRLKMEFKRHISDNSHGSRRSLEKSIERGRRNEQRRQAVKNTLFSPGFELFNFWDGRIARVAATFGSNVASYFKFIRFLMFMNFAIGLLMFCFVSLPQEHLSQTIFFYGAYANKTIVGNDGDSLVTYYDQPLAYLMTWLSVNVLSLLILVLNMYHNYRQSKKISDKEDPYSALCFGGWDFSVTSHETTKMWAKAMATRLREIKTEDSMDRRKTLKQQCAIWFVRIVCKLGTLMLLGGSGYLIYYVADTTIDPGDTVPQFFGDFFVKYQLSLVVSGLKLIIPKLILILLIFEQWHPRTEIKLQIVQTALFYGASLVVFLISVYTTTGKGCFPGGSDKPRETTTTRIKSKYCCWENDLAEQIFQISILDLIIRSVAAVLSYGGRALFVNCCKLKKIEYAEFHVAVNILDLVYCQAILWLGLFVAPFMAWFGVITFFFTFYIQCGLVTAFCLPSRSIFMASRSGSFFRFILLVTLFACLVPLTYGIANLAPSMSCGPFRGRDRMYRSLTDRIRDSPEWFHEGLQYITTPIVAFPVYILLILLTVYYKVKSTAHQMAAKDLQNHLQFERRVMKRRVIAKAKRYTVISGIEDNTEERAKEKKRRKDKDGSYLREKEK